MDPSPLKLVLGAQCGFEWLNTRGSHLQKPRKTPKLQSHTDNHEGSCHSPCPLRHNSGFRYVQGGLQCREARKERE